MTTIVDLERPELYASDHNSHASDYVQDLTNVEPSA